MKPIHFLLLLIAPSFFACEEIIDDVTLSDTPDLICVDGIFTDHAKSHRFKISKTREYFSDESFPAVSGAQVSISNIGSGDIVSVLTESADTPGVYFTEPDVKGLPGEKYRLEIIYEGDTFIGEDSMTTVNSLDSIVIAPNEFDEKTNSIYIYALEPKEQENYYMWHIYFNGEPYIDYQSLPFADDKYLNDTIKHIEIYSDALFLDPPRNYISDPLVDSVNIYIEQMGITREAFNFLNSLNAILNKGGMFDSPMAQVKSNIWKIDKDGKTTDNQTGFFMVCSVKDNETNILRK